MPGLNPAIKAVVRRAIAEGHEVLGFRRGWGGLLELNRDDPESIAKNTIKLDLNAVRIVDRSGGTFLHTSRTNVGGTGSCSVNCHIRDDGGTIVNKELYLFQSDLLDWELGASTSITVDGKLPSYWPN